MKTLLLLLVGLIAIQANEVRSLEYKVRVWEYGNFQGHYKDFTKKVPYLDVEDFDNTITSVRVTGVWIFYDMPEYNTFDISRVHYTWGIDYGDSFHDELRDHASSLRYAGHQGNFNEDGYNLYEGPLFTKREVYGNHNIPDVSVLHEDTASVIIIGRSSWTFYDNVDYTGNRICLHADHTVSENYYRLDVGFCEDIHTPQGLYAVKSIRKGCHTV